MTNTPIQHKRLLGLIVAFAAICWVSLAWLIFRLNVGDYDNFWYPGRTLAYILLLTAPALTFVPIGRALGLASYGYWTTLGWAVFGFVLAFVPFDATVGFNQSLIPLIILLVSFFMVLVSVFMPLFYGLGSRVFSKRTTRYDYSRAWREAILLAGYIILMAFLRTIDAFSSLNALLLFLVLVVLELLFLARSR